jgi:hypothetical protein
MMPGWVTVLITSILRALTTASSRHLFFGAGWFLLLAGLIFNSMATLILGGAVVFFLFMNPQLKS